MRIFENDKTPVTRVGMDTPLNEMNPKPRAVVTVRIKNRSSAPRIIYDAALRPVKLAVGEAKAIEVSAKYARRVQAESLRGGSLVVLDASELEGTGEVRRVRLQGKGHDTATKVPSTTSVRAPKNKTKHGATSKSSGKPAKAPASVVRPDIKTAAGLLRVQQSNDPLPYNHYKSVAFRVLPAGTLAPGANKLAIEKALAAAVADD